MEPGKVHAGIGMIEAYNFNMMMKKT